MGDLVADLRRLGAEPLGNGSRGGGVTAVLEARRAGRPYELPRAVFFDCFGTLLAMETDDFIAAMGRLCERQGLACAGERLWDAWLAGWRAMEEDAGRDLSRLVDDGPEPPFRTYRQRWPEQFARAFGSLGLAGDPADATEFMVRTLRQVGPLGDALRVVRALASRYLVGALSNADEEFLLPPLERSGFLLHAVVSSENARAYKPRRRIFRHAERVLGLAGEDLLYVGDHPLADLLGAAAAGWRTVWLNRDGRELPEDVPPPELVVRDLRDLLTGLGVSDDSA